MARALAVIFSASIALSPSLQPAWAADDLVNLNFKDAEIDSVVGAFGHLLGRTFIIDPRVRGKLTLETPTPVNRQQAYQMLQAALRMQGFAVVEANGIGKIVPEAEAKLQPGPVAAGRGAGERNGEQVVTQIFRLQYESAANMVPVLRPLISPNNTITAYPNNNSLVVTDYAANIQRIARIVASLDGPTSGEVEVVQMRHAIASDVALAVTRMIDETARPGVAGATPAGGDPGQRVTVLADPRMNAVMIRSNSPSRVNLAKSLIARMDVPTATPGNIHVVYLRNAEATRLAQVLRGVLAGGGTDPNAHNSQTATGMSQSAVGQALGSMGSMGSSGSTLGGTTGNQNSPANSPLQGSAGGQQGVQAIVAGGAVIAADPSTNSLIITAPEALYRNLRDVIDRLDARRAQVYIESLIVEISADRAAELGIQWQALNAGDGSGNRFFGGTNFGTTGQNIIGVAGNPGTIGAGLNLGIVRGSINVPGIGQILNLGFLARALETKSNANILATPNLVTLDNEEARIIIGQNVPFVTGSYVTNSSGASNPFQTVERKDVGTTLRVRPQVSDSGTVRMQIFQEVSSVADTTNAAGIITNRRAIESNVIVDDGQMIVLGGLIEDRVEGSVSKVPGLGDVPVVGQLFRYDNRHRVKTNLLVFLRPIVIRDNDTSYSVTSSRYDYIRQMQGDSRLPSHWAMPDFAPTPVPAMPPRPAANPAANPGQPSQPISPTSSPSPAPQPGSGQPPGISVAPSRSVPAAAEGSTVRQSTTDGTYSSRTPVAPEVSADGRNQSPAPIMRSRPTMLRTEPNEAMVPLNRPVEITPITPPAGGR